MASASVKFKAFNLFLTFKFNVMKKRIKILAASIFLSGAMLVTIAEIQASKQLLIAADDKCVWDLQTDCTEPPVTYNCSGCN